MHTRAQPATPAESIQAFMCMKIEDAWARRDEMSVGELRDHVGQQVEQAMRLIEAGTVRAAEPLADGSWQVNAWVKQAILLGFKIWDNQHRAAGNAGNWFDKVDHRFDHWRRKEFEAARVRAVPGSIARIGTYIGPNVILMPCFVNIGAYVGAGTMIDTWATVGSCAQVGQNCHISGGAGIGGVLEPPQATPTIIEDDVFIGARSEVVEGCIVRAGATLAMGCFMAQGTPILNAMTGDVTFGVIPPDAVVIPGGIPKQKILPGTEDGKSRKGDKVIDYSTSALIIVKYADAGTRAKTSREEILRTAA